MVKKRWNEYSNAFANLFVFSFILIIVCALLLTMAVDQTLRKVLLGLLFLFIVTAFYGIFSALSSSLLDVHTKLGKESIILYTFFFVFTLLASMINVAYKDALQGEAWFIFAPIFFGLTCIPFTLMSLKLYHKKHK